MRENCSSKCGHSLELSSPPPPPLCSYVDRFWRQSVFEGLRLVRAALDDSYGADQVSLVSAAFRWMNHHSLMTPDAGGILYNTHSLPLHLSLSLSLLLFPPSLPPTSDAIILGVSKMDHLEANLKACEEGPLHESEYIATPTTTPDHHLVSGAQVL